MNTKIYMILRIVCSIVAALFCAAAVFVFVYAGWLWGIVCVVGAALFAGLMLVFKRKQTDRENAENPPPPKGDFITGPVHINDEANGGNDTHADKNR